MITRSSIALFLVLIRCSFATAKERTYNLEHRENRAANQGSIEITDTTFKLLLRECLSELATDPTACDKVAHWDVSRVTDCSLLFWEPMKEDPNNDKLISGAEVFNVDLSQWDVSGCTTMKSMFHGADAFNQFIGEWNVAKVTDMSHMFQGATTFNQDISVWDTSNVADMSHMFRNAANFHNDYLDWKTQKVRQFSYMFLDADTFNGQIGHWDISSAADWDLQTGGIDEVPYLALVAMFDGANAFNQPLHHWDVRNIKRFDFMFQAATSFNQDLTPWDVRQATDFTGMFHNAASFNQTLCWEVNPRSKQEKMMDGTIDGSQVDGDVGCWIEKERTKTFPPLPTGPGRAAAAHAPHITPKKEGISTAKIVGIILTLLGFMGVLVRLRRNKIACRSGEEEIFFDDSNDTFPAEHPNGRRDVVVYLDEPSREVFLNEQSEGSIYFDRQDDDEGRSTLWNDTFTDQLQDDSERVPLEQTVAAMEGGNYYTDGAENIEMPVVGNWKGRSNRSFGRRVIDVDNIRSTETDSGIDC